MYLREYQLVQDIVSNEWWNKVEPGFKQGHRRCGISRVPFIAENTVRNEMVQGYFEYLLDCTSDLW